MKRRLRKYLVILLFLGVFHSIYLLSQDLDVDPCQQKKVLYGSQGVIGGYNPNPTTSGVSGPCFTFRSKADFIEALQGKQGSEKLKEAMIDLSPHLKAHLGNEREKSLLRPLRIQLEDRSEINTAEVIDALKKLRPSQLQYYALNSYSFADVRELSFWYEELKIQPSFGDHKFSMVQEKNLSGMQGDFSPTHAQVKQRNQLMATYSRKNGYKAMTDFLSEKSWSEIESRYPELKKLILDSPTAWEESGEPKIKILEPSLEETTQALKRLLIDYHNAKGVKKDELKLILEELVLNASFGCQVRIIEVITQSNIDGIYDKALNGMLKTSDGNWKNYHSLLRSESAMKTYMPTWTVPDQPRQRCEDGVKLLFQKAKDDAQVDLLLSLGEKIHNGIVSGEEPSSVGENLYSPGFDVSENSVYFKYFNENPFVSEELKNQMMELWDKLEALSSPVPPKESADEIEYVEEFPLEEEVTENPYHPAY